MSDQANRPESTTREIRASVLARPFRPVRVLYLVLMLAPLLVWFAWSWGRQETRSELVAGSFRVQGNSMAPTLLGEHEVAKCDACGLLWFVEAAAKQPSPKSMLCSHCGDNLRLVDRAQLEGAESLWTADVVDLQVTDEDGSELVRGDLVAIRWNDQLHVKRVAALPGDTVGLDRLHLIVNGQRFEDMLYQLRASHPLPRFLVDQDSRRTVSRWSPIAGGSPWKRMPDGQWKNDRPSDSSWLVYQHRSVYDNHRPSPVWDDCPMNVRLNRKLERVDRLSLRGEVRSDSKFLLEIAFWSRGGNVAATVTSTANQKFDVSYYDATPADGLPVSAESPVAVRVLDGLVTLRGLMLQRSIEYRIRRQDARDPFPLRVGRTECFVLGDNVPISIDSRTFGLIPRANIVGRVIQRRKASSEIEVR